MEILRLIKNVIIIVVYIEKFFENDVCMFQRRFRVHYYLAVT